MSHTPHVVDMVLILTHEPSKLVYEWDARGRIPNCVAAFIDPFWEGCFSVNCTSVPQEDATVFRVQFCLRPLKLSTLQDIMAANKEKRAFGGRKSICNSIKLHFYFEHPENEKAMTERRRDILYSTAIRLDTLIAPPNKVVEYGVFNYNADETSSSTIDGIKVYCVPMRPLVLPADTIMLAAKGAGEEHHRRVMRFSEWVNDVFHELSPNETTPFSTWRTYGRDFCSALLFQDLYKYFDTNAANYGSSLPASLAVYALCNALITNDCTLAFFLENMHKGSFLPKLLSILRDLFAPFTMCRKEGVYWADKSCDKAVEDQWHADSSEVPADRIFKRDDCEGRAAQVQMMVQLLISIAAAVNIAGGFKTLFAEIKGYGAPLHLDDATLRDALMACVYIGRMLSGNNDTDEQASERRAAARSAGKDASVWNLQLHTTVGDACFAQFSEHGRRSPCLTGHSFAMAMDAECTTHCIIETTGWERVAWPSAYIDADEAARRELTYQRNATAFHEELAGVLLKAGVPSKDKAQDRQPLECTILSHARENDIYRKIVLGHDYLYFTRHKDGTLPHLGVHMRDIRNGGVYTYATHPASETWMRRDTPKSAKAFRMRTRRFLQELCAEPPSDASDARGKASSNHRTSRMWPHMHGAEEMLKEYDAIQAALPGMKRTTCPPPVQQLRVLEIMRKWGTIGTNDLIRVPRDGGARCIWFSIPNAPTVAETDTVKYAILSHFNQEEDGRIRCYPFMSSHMFSIQF